MNSMDAERYLKKNSIIPQKHDPFPSLNDQLHSEVEKIICIVADKRSILALINLLDDQEYDIRWIAAESLIRIGRKTIVPLLRTIRDGKKFSYPGKAHHVLQCLLTRSEKKALRALLVSLKMNSVTEKAEIAASIALKNVFCCSN